MRPYCHFTATAAVVGNLVGMSTTTQGIDRPRIDRRSKAKVKRLLAAVDRIIVAAKQAERARDELARETEGRDDG